ncbi:AGL113Cp [Eremothecium gossypii ATCC 10895]|uniref:Phosphatidylinositol 3-kinase VPS34 n=1 Tax=Eremothecium gossypii (strain ATCC 10895 / CBS 109.51 / FGSC 9923 / NRRL Y-1056) TaxID=284811 RepID=Q750Q5_EREGS|nr:AGL113Cp [Eremothecium gossypii ATCC 10895]AAS54378.1 AGL113Cp [Eremothecium gossypii ATCC 10895]AEY98705.1 FAGL113Cp [Eremothecium gossypii FDAG1]
MPSQSVTFVVSQELNIPLKIKISSLHGTKKLLQPSQRFTHPELTQRTSNMRLNSDMFVSVQVFDRERNRALTTPVHTQYVPFKTGRVWNQWLTLPIYINQLDRNSTLQITIWEYDAANCIEFATLKTPVFSDADCTLKRGREALHFEYGAPESSRVEGDAIQGLLNKYDQGGIKAIDWLDSLTFKKLESMQREADLPKGTFRLNIEFPLFELPVVYTEATNTNVQKNIPTLNNFEPPSETIESKMDSQAKISVGSPRQSTLKFYDLDQYNVDVIEEKFRRLERSSKSSNLDRELKPDAKKRDILNHIIAYPPCTSLTPHEKGLVWKYRYYLVNNKKALTKLLQSTNLAEENERKEVLDLMDLWAEIDIDDAIELLGPVYKNLSVRSYAVNRLKKASDTELELYLLQLVQAVCFESSSTWSDKSNSAFTIVHMDQSKNGNCTPKSLTPHMTASLDSLDRSDVESNGAESSIVISPLAEFLIRRVVNNTRLSNYFYWFLKSESKGTQYLVHILDSFLVRLSQESRGQIEDQVQLVNLLKECCCEVKQLKDTTPKKHELLHYLMLSKVRPFLRATNVALPLDPEVVAVDVVPEDCKVFKSSLSPLKITFKTKDARKYSLMFKVGDDLRQDQFVVQIITLMNALLKNENVDLKLTPYRILATGHNEGAIEFIPNDTMANILSKHHGILPFLKSNFPDRGEPLGVQDWVMDNFVKSCAGYCVITYILGVGDRHLDNLLIAPDGRFFHADFGYILGRDPKPFPPLMKLPPQIIEAFGGAESNNYNKFRSYCFVAYSILRRNAGLILNLFELMKTSDIPDIQMDPDGAILKVKEKFCLNMSEEQATVHFQNLINASVNALLPLVIDHLHNLAQYWRS